MIYAVNVAERDRKGLEDFYFPIPLLDKPKEIVTPLTEDDKAKMLQEAQNRLSVFNR